MRISDLGAVVWRDLPAGGTRALVDSLADDEAELLLAPAWAPATAMPALAAFLAPGERAAFGRYASPEARDRAILSRAVLRLVLARHVGLPPETLDIAAAEGGKPFLRNDDAAGGRLAFNLSHTRDLILCAVARAPVGVDIEGIASIPDLAAFSRVVLGETERAAFAALPAERRLDHVCRIWVCKEALAKKSGEGIRRDFAGFDLRDDTDSALALFTPQAGHIAAVATSPDVTVLRFLRISGIGDLLRIPR